MLHYNSLRKYTLALLSTFNDLEVSYLGSDGVTEFSRKIPIKFSSREKSIMMDDYTTGQILAGNTNVLPRISLVLTSVIKAEQRTANKYTKHNVEAGNPDGADYNYAPVAYEFMYELIVMCRGMNEASMIIEQIAPRFNPNYTVRINEVPNAEEATSVPLSLLDIGLEFEEYEEISTNIVTLSMGIGLKGNFYPPVQNSPKIKNVSLFNSILTDDNEFRRASLQEWDVTDTIVEDTGTVTPLPDTITPVVTDINAVFQVGEVPVSAEYSDAYNKLEELIFVWTVMSGDATIETGTKDVLMTVNSGVSATVRCQVIDIHGNTSDVFDKII